MDYGCDSAAHFPILMGRHQESLLPIGGLVNAIICPVFFSQLWQKLLVIKYSKLERTSLISDAFLLLGSSFTSLFFARFSNHQMKVCVTYELMHYQYGSLFIK